MEVVTSIAASYAQLVANFVTASPMAFLTGTVFVFLVLIPSVVQAFRRTDSVGYSHPEDFYRDIESFDVDELIEELENQVGHLSINIEFNNPEAVNVVEKNVKEIDGYVSSLESIHRDLMSTRESLLRFSKFRGTPDVTMRERIS